MQRQYIGARYVPIFADPIEWDNQRSFEPLTIVTYLGASYTSKKNVPSGVKPTDNEYWVLTGNYNAQIEEYRLETEKVKTSLNNITLYGKTCAFFGDSITYGTMPNDTRANKPYPTIFGELMGCTIKNYAKNGASMCSLYSGENNLENQLKNSDLSNVDHVFICFGENDFNTREPLGSMNYGTQDFNTFYGAMVSACKYIQSNGKESVNIHFISTLYSGTYYTNRIMSNGYPCTVGTYGEAVKKFCNYNNVSYIDLTSSCYKSRYTYQNMSGGSVHLTENGYTNIGYTLSQTFSGSSAVEMKYNGENIISRWLFKNSSVDLIGATDNGVTLSFNQGNKVQKSKTNLGIRKGYVKIKGHIYCNITNYTKIGDKNVALEIRINNKLIGVLWDVFVGSSYDFEIDCYSDTYNGELEISANVDYDNFLMNVLNLEIIPESSANGKISKHIKVTPLDSKLFSNYYSELSYDDNGTMCNIVFRGVLSKEISGVTNLFNIPMCNNLQNTNYAFTGLVQTVPNAFQYDTNTGLIKTFANGSTGNEIRFSVTLPV